jgi:hypothetical protein
MEMDFYNGTGPAREIKRPMAVATRLARAGETTEPACSGLGPQRSPDHRGGETPERGRRRSRLRRRGGGRDQRPAPAKPWPTKTRNTVAREW